MSTVYTYMTDGSMVYGDNRDHLYGEWTAGDWVALNDLLRLDGYRIKHCAHCDRYADGDPNQHPSCHIVEDERQHAR